MSGESGILRRFNSAGIAEFVRRIETLRAGGEAEIDDAFVTDAKFTEPVVPEVPIERPAFKTKRDAGAYLSERTRAARAVHGDDDRGLWTWLSAWHWDAVCPVREDERRKVLGTYNYVFGFSNSQNTKKHLIRVGVVVWEAWPNTRLLLDSPPWTLNQVVQTVITSMLLSRIPAMGDLVDMLYRDPHRNAAKPGIIDARVTKPGDLVNRLPARIRQLEVTHDLTNLTAEQLLNLLGDEFRHWAVTPAEAPATTRQPTRRVASPPPVPPGTPQRTPS